jgi:hypothetical protein
MFGGQQTDKVSDAARGRGSSLMATRNTGARRQGDGEEEEEGDERDRK